MVDTPRVSSVRTITNDAVSGHIPVLILRYCLMLGWAVEPIANPTSMAMCAVQPGCYDFWPKARVELVEQVNER